jgi:hypothetical protein
MDRCNLPKHVVESMERRWARRFEQQALASQRWRSGADCAARREAPLVSGAKRAARAPPPDAPAVGTPDHRPAGSWTAK